MLSCETQTQKEKTTVVKINGNYEMYYDKANYALLWSFPPPIVRKVMHSSQQAPFH